MAWICLVYNLIVCIQLVTALGFDFFSLFNVLVFSSTNGIAIITTIIGYKKLNYLNAIGPLILLTQFGPCLQVRLHDELSEKSIFLVQCSAITIYCLVIFTMITKWIVQAPLAFL